MAIAKISKGNGFRGVMDYLLDPDKRPRIISGCVFTDVPADLAREFRMVANLRRSVTKPVRHFSISFSPEDGDVDDITKEAIAFRILDGLGYGECQFIAIDHHRDKLDTIMLTTTTTVIRMRPHRLMFKASKTDDGWEPVGFPNIEQRDVEQLERFNGVEPEKFENVAEQPTEQRDIYPVFQRSKPVESRNISRGMSL